MSSKFLEMVVAETRERVANARSNGYFDKLKKAAEMRSDLNKCGGFYSAFSADSVNVIAEIKRSSPSKGVLKAEVDVPQTAKLYAAGGAAAISVLTEPKHFDGTISDLVTVTKTVELPVLRKDFIVDEYQIVEAFAAGASAILLIAAALETNELDALHSTANDLGLDVLVEVHNASEMHKAIDIGATLIGVNNRDLSSLEVSLDTSRKLVELKPDSAIFISESGITSRDEIDELRGLGYDGFLIGEALMRSGNIVETLRGLSQ